MSANVGLESWYSEPSAIHVAVMAGFEVLMSSRYITFTKDRTKNTANE